MDTNNISSILEAIAKANEAVKQVPALEAEIKDLNGILDQSYAVIATLKDQVHTQQSTLTDRAETIARLEKELSEARFREQAAREANDRAITTLRDIVDFANVALPVPAKPEVVEEAKPEPVPLAEPAGVQSGEVMKSNITASTEAIPEGAGDTEKASKPYLGQSWMAKPNWVTDSEWEAEGGQPHWEYQGYASKPSWW